MAGQDGSQTIPPAVEPLFEIRETPAGFLGAFARVPIAQGTLVLDDPPLFTLDAPLQAYLFQRAQSGSGSGPTPVEGEEEEEEPPKTLEEFLDKAIRTMLSWKTDEQRKEFWDLANTRPELPPAYGIFATNAVQTSDETGGMFLLLSRFNSSCRPALSRPAWNPSTNSTRLYALRDISTGDELTWTYLNVTFEFEGVEARKAEMLRVFEFECCCEACDDTRVGPEARNESEKRLLRLRRLKERIGWTGESRTAGQTDGRMEVLREMVDLSRLEGLWETADRLEKAIEHA
ncbi:setdomain containing protein [Rhodotorula toruloides]|uniref:Setdomain containing protein n=1 Tax=Rhodotorula toruloides TaxID=5286 RepID=A0A511KCY1_RHOTO|nr:setdomain containing protein [Rhodotorula toruloides]